MVENQIVVYDAPIWTVYMHVNKINNKKYIGITSQKPEKRWRNGNGYSSCNAFYKAICSVGWDNFDHQILLKNITRELACIMEVILITYYNTHVSHGEGYNIDTGGKYGAHGRILSDTTKKLISANHADLSGENCYWYGKTRSEETKNKISNNRRGKMTGKNNHASKPVVCINTSETFCSLTDGSKKYHTTKSQITKCCVGDARYAGFANGVPLIWRYVEDYNTLTVDDINKLLSTEIRINNQRRTICLETLEVFDNYRIPSKLINIKDSSHIGTACRNSSNGKFTSCGGYHWMYHVDYLNLSVDEKHILMEKYYTGNKLVMKEGCL